MKIAVVIPAFNEARWVRQAVDRLLQTPPPREGRGSAAEPVCERLLILVDDGSTDGTAQIIDDLAREGSVIAERHAVNRGKGAALRTGFARALALGADVVLVHDADLEYDPADHDAILRPILDGRADAVIGSRFIGNTHRVLYYWHAVANTCITHLCNMATNLNLTDVECCSKALTAPLLRAVALTEERFGIEIELVAKIARARLDHPDTPGSPRPHSPRSPRSPARVFEVGVSYAGRTYDEGKKIGWEDGLVALWCIVKHGVFGP